MAAELPLLLSIWREVGRHLELAESIPTLAGIVAAEPSISRVLVRRIDLAKRVIETVGPDPDRSTSTPAQMKLLSAWGKSGRRLQGTVGAQLPAEIATLLPAATLGAVLAVPLGSEAHPAGALLLLARPGAAFGTQEALLIDSLREPFTVALENDQRLHEIQKLRASAEADRRSLLARLGRQELVDEIVGTHSGLQQVMERVDLIAPSDVPVLIFGDTGTGKELVARTIHQRSPRSAAPFLRVNCGAIPPELIDSELFGHVRGSFTGAIADRRGWFERAHGGTLFLDEIGELPLAAQVRLLTVVQDGWLDRVGGQQPIQVDVRIVAATHRDLPAMVRDGKFREDLWYRLAVFSILLPPLRERPQDIAPLAAHLARRAATRFGLPVGTLTNEDIRLLVGYHWPGNVRELGAVIDRAAILGEGRHLDVATAMGVPPLTTSADEIHQAEGGGAAPGGFATMSEAMRKHIEHALAATRGRIEGPDGAAALLQINPHTLRARMRKLAIPWGRFRS